MQLRCAEAPQARGSPALAPSNRIRFFYPGFMRRVLAIIVALGPIVSVSLAQMAVTFGCLESYGRQSWDDGAISDPNDEHFGGRAELVETADLHFELVRTPGRIARIRALPSKSLAGFSARYGVRRIRIFARIAPVPEFLGQGSAYAPPSHYAGAAEGHFYVELQNRAGSPSYYAIRESLSTIESPADSCREQAAFDMFRATPDSAIPLIVLQTSTPESEGHALYCGATRHLIDFRQARPRSVAALEGRRDAETVGTDCWLDTVRNVGKSSLTCDWVSKQEDFQCIRQRTSLTAWGGRTWQDRFLLISRSVLPPFESAGGVPSSPDAWAGILRKEPSDPTGRIMAFPKFGETSVLWSEEPGRRAMLLAARGNTGHLWPRFLYVVFKSSGIAQTDDLQIGTLGPSRTAESGDAAKDEIDGWAKSDQLGGLTGAAVRLTVKPLDSALPDVHFFQVLLTEGSHRALFWVGLDGRIEPHRGQALLIASDAGEYDACRELLVPPSAAAAEWTGSVPILAKLDVEPARRREVYQGGYMTASLAYGKPVLRETGCPSYVELGWSSEQGWLINRKSHECDTGKPVIRAIAISDTGQVSASPAKMVDNDR